jgi:hypothetical protein
MMRSVSICVVALAFNQFALGNATADDVSTKWGDATTTTSVATTGCVPKSDKCDVDGEVEALLQTKASRRSINQQPCITDPDRYEYVSAGGGQCVDEDGATIQASDPRSIGYAEPAGGTPFGECKVQCSKMCNCAAFQYLDNYCWLFAKMDKPYVSANPYAWGHIGCYIKKLISAKEPGAGVLISNEGKHYPQAKPWKIGSVWVYGAYESGWFKMVSVDKDGKKIETKHSKTFLKDSMSSTELAAAWDAANKGGGYNVEVHEVS